MASRTLSSFTKIARVIPSSSRSFASSSISRNELSPKLTSIVDSIATLNLLEVADLVSALKIRLNIADIAMAAPSSAPAAAAVVAEVEVVKEKTAFNVTLTKIDPTQKAKAIREVKAIMPSMNLVEAKKFVESLPKVLKEGATKEEAEKLKKALEAVGAEITMD